jgi:hypothetical protein
VPLLGGKARRVLLRIEEGTRRLVVRLRCRDRHELALGIAQRGERAAEDAPGVDVDRVIEPLRLTHWRVAVNDHRTTAIVRSPVEAHR